MASSRVTVIGRKEHPSSHWARKFLTRNHVPFYWIDIEQNFLMRLTKQAFLRSGQMLPGYLTRDAPPHLRFPDGTVEQLPASPETDVAFRRRLARRVGLHTKPSSRDYHLIIVGGGPAGLAAAAYAAYEGLKTVVLEQDAPGGQAGTSACIRNYLGFPEGVTGEELARRAHAQVVSLEAEVVVPAKVTGVRRVVKPTPGRAEPPLSERSVQVDLDDGNSLLADAVFAATGVSYVELDAGGIEELTGRGVYYGGAEIEASSYRGRPVGVVGGGNSAGQAAAELARYASKVTVFVRSGNLRGKMSEGAAKALEVNPVVEVCLNSSIVEVTGKSQLESVLYADASGGTKQLHVQALFIYTGTRPRSEWAGSEIRRNEQGYVEAGPSLRGEDYDYFPETDRDPLPLETSVPRVFVGGDVRAGASPRVGIAVGDGAFVVRLYDELPR